MSGGARAAQRIRIAAAAGLGLVLAAGPGCGGPAALETSRGVVARWFEALAAGDAEAALALYAPPVARGEGAAPLRSRLRALARRGPPRAREELAWTVHARVEDDGTGWFVTLLERAEWPGCTLTLRFHMHRSFGGGEARILGHERTGADGCDEDGVAV